MLRSVCIYLVRAPRALECFIVALLFLKSRIPRRRVREPYRQKRSPT
jgi:hypothetical protein